MKRDEVAVLLADKFKRESYRLKSWGTKTDDKAAITFAMSVIDFVRALMCDSRYRELKRLRKVLDKQPSHGDLHKIWDFWKERSRATKAMTAALNHTAEEAEKKRPYKSKPKEKHKHHHHHHHGH